MGRRRRRGDEVDPASDGTADAERRERQSSLRRLLRDQFPDATGTSYYPCCTSWNTNMVTSRSGRCRL